MTQKRKIVVLNTETVKGRTETINFDEIGITNDFMFGTVFRDKEKCKELVLADKRRTYFVNINGNREGISEDTTKLLDYFKTGQPTDSYTENIRNQVKIIREDDDWRENYMTIEMKMDQKYEQGRKIGRNEGEVSKEKELIERWLKKGRTIAEIAEDLDRTEESVRHLYDPDGGNKE